MRGCAGAGSTQARTLTCMSPPPRGLHPCFDLYGFRVLPNSDHAPVFLSFCTRLEQAGARYGPSGSSLLVFFEIEPCLNQLDLSRLHGCKAWVWVWLEASGFLQMELWGDATNPEQVDLSRPGGCRVWAGSGSRLL